MTTSHGNAEASQKSLRLKAAMERSNYVSNVHYDLSFNLTGSEKEFSGISRIHFNLKSKPKSLPIDFIGGEVTSIQVNGKKTKFDYNKHQISISLNLISNQKNIVEIQFTHPYSQFGSGLYRFKDKVDNQSYLYTDFEPYDANRLFPCFDQPDLKASYRTSVLAPKKWEVITPVRESKVTPNGSNKRWDFPSTKRFSTYIYALHAGPYKYWKSSAGNIPLRLYARQSLAKFVDHQKWFKITQQGFGFFQKYFDYNYPFGKYDQVIVPDFNSGAMENVGAVTFTERYVYRDTPSRKQELRRASVILHEMAHMWFGNLVTMKWWDDLWLNESFATVMASYSLHQATEYKDIAWQSFFTGMKQWAYYEDQLSTTHPIAATINSTDEAFANFDGITYGKGAAVVKQLMFKLGENKFRDGVRAYFKKHAFQNARLNDFIESLEKSSSTKLTAWRDEWLKSSGLNQVSLDYQCQGKQLKSFKLIQSNSEKSKQLRQHLTKLVFLRLNQNNLEIYHDQLVDYRSGTKTVQLEKPIECPAVVFTNHDDLDYVKVKLDQKSLKNLDLHISKVKNNMLRTMLWETMWSMVRSSDLSVTRFLEVLHKHIHKENDSQILRKIAGHMRRSIHDYLPKGKSAQAHKFSDLLWTTAKKTKNNSDLQLVFFDAFVSIVDSKRDQKRLYQVLNSKTHPKRWSETDRRWRIVTKLSSLENKSNAQRLIAKELKKDNSQRSRLAALTAEASINSWDHKIALYHKIKTKEYKTVAEHKAIMYGFFPSNQDKLRSRFTRSFYQDLVSYNKKSNSVFLKKFAQIMIPLTCDSSANQMAKSFIQKNPSLKTTVIKAIRKEIDEDTRCQKIRAKAL